MPRAATTALLVVLIAAGAVLRIVSIRGRRGWEHDDAMAIAMSSGHPASSWKLLEGRWVPAGRWRQLLEAGPGLRLGTVSRETVDIHPPLWLWVVHAWKLLLGVNLWSVPLLNLLIALATGAVLHSLARDGLGDGHAALLAVALWALSPASISTTTVERSYELLTFVTVAMARLVLPPAHPSAPMSRARLLGVAALSVAGLLLHYLFVFVYVACGVVLLAGRGKGLRREGLLAGALLAGVLAHPLLNPGFGRAFALAGQMTGPITGQRTTLLDRFGSPVQPVNLFVDGSFFAPAWRDPWSGVLMAAWALVLAGLLAVAAAPLLRQRARGERTGVPRFSPAGLCVLFGATILGCAQAAFLVGLTPQHASTARYVSNVWPFAAIGVAALVQLVPRHAKEAGAVVAALMLASGSLHVRTTDLAGRQGLEGLRIVGEADAVVANNPSFAVLPRVVTVLPPGTPVFVAWDGQLLERPGAWLEERPPEARSLALVSSDYSWDPNTPESEAAVLRKAEDLLGPPVAGARLLRVGAVRLFRLGPPEGDSPADPPR